jgi:hypothetical protein
MRRGFEPVMQRLISPSHAMPALVAAEDTHFKEAASGPFSMHRQANQADARLIPLLFVAHLPYFKTEASTSSQWRFRNTAIISHLARVRDRSTD